jgi:hypothetical protein
MKHCILLFLSFALASSPPARCGESSGPAPAAIQAPDPNSCVANFGVPCYSPQQLQEAYGLAPLLNAGYDGAGQTIVYRILRQSDHGSRSEGV